MRLPLLVLGLRSIAVDGAREREGLASKGATLEFLEKAT
jgi:hypothetical protein